MYLIVFVCSKLSWLQVPGLLKMGLLKRRNSWMRMSYNRMSWDVIGSKHAMIEDASAATWASSLVAAPIGATALPVMLASICWTLNKLSVFQWAINQSYNLLYKIEYAGFNLHRKGRTKTFILLVLIAAEPQSNSCLYAKMLNYINKYNIYIIIYILRIYIYIILISHKHTNYYKK